MLRWTRPWPRLIVDGAMVMCLMLAFAYWWLGNAVHEATGTVFLIIVLRHVGNNLFWWKGLRCGGMTVQRAFNLIVGMGLTVTIALLLITSIGVSRVLAQWLPMPRFFILQEVHWFAAYWVIALAALHLGVNWVRIFALLRMVAGRGVPRWGVPVLWLMGMAAAIQGIFSGTILGFWPRLRFSYALSMWDFNASVLPFFAHWGATLMTIAMAAHLAVLMTTRLLRRRVG
ncbi:DUF4405 domain-containing protein [Thioclava sp. SK-1]|uniref:DUF4405 domain-containing protein n=1 Tax=Thioclava sp. SK-1 TaxID=1889770 RepID=UPI00159F0EF0|nr:DUF4405 domain-containing protein [Thioclava sp. SK-1]